MSKQPRWIPVAGIVLAVVAGVFPATGQPAGISGRADPGVADVTAVLNLSALQPGQQAVLAVVVDLGPGLHAQSNKPLDENLTALVVKVEAPPAVAVFAPQYPKPVEKTYPGLGRQSVYSGRVVVYVPIQLKAEAPVGPLAMVASAKYQLCSDDGTCYFPQEAKVPVQTKVVAAGQAVEPNRPELFAGFDPTSFASLSPAEKGTAIGFFGSEFTLGSRSYLLAFGVAFVVGILFNFMPCVLPVVPLKAIGFYEVSQHNRARSLALGLVFSLGLVASFAVLAVLVVGFQFLWGEQFSKPWFTWGIVAILVVMALGMFGLFTVLLPSGAYSWTPRHDTYTGNFLFGILAAILSTPCTAPMFAGLLAWAASQPKALAVAVIMMVGVGMAAPYILLSAMPEVARRFPRSGPWAETIKQMMGFLLLAVAAFFAGSRLLEGFGFLWLVTGVIVVGSVFLVVRTAMYSRRRVAVVASGLLAVLLSGTSLWATLQFANLIPWKPYSPELLASARQEGKVVMVEFTAKWCANCLALEGTVFRDKRVLEAIQRHGVQPLKVDLTDTSQDTPGKRLLGELNAGGGIPLTAVYPANGGEPILLSSVYRAQNLLDAIAKAASTPRRASAAR